MNKLALALLTTFLVTGCSTFGKKEDKVVTSEFSKGDIKISYTLGGDIDSITSTSSARVSSTLPGAVDEAVSVATMRARRQLSEFIKSEIETDRFVNTVTDSLQNSEAFGGESGTSKSVKSKIVYDVKESMKQKSSAILRGTYVDSKSYDSDTKTVLVTIRSSPKDVANSKTLKAMMGD
jgi:hypothetical protein